MMSVDVLAGNYRAEEAEMEGQYVWKEGGECWILDDWNSLLCHEGE